MEVLIFYLISTINFNIANKIKGDDYEKVFSNM